MDRKPYSGGMMKKIIPALALFLLIFIAAIICRFPYAEYMEKSLAELNSGKDIKIRWTDSQNKFPCVYLKNVTVASKQGVLLKLSEMTIKASLFGGFKFEGVGENNLSVKGYLKNSTVNFDIDNYAFPTFVSAVVGNGNFRFTGKYRLNEKEGDIDFNGTIDNIPTPLIKESMNINGTASIKGPETAVKFDASGKTLSGSGIANIKGNKIAGNIKIDTGIIPINIILSGELDNIKLKFNSTLN